jgi:hypothetical protein
MTTGLLRRPKDGSSIRLLKVEFTNFFRKPGILKKLFDVKVSKKIFLLPPMQRSQRTLHRRQLDKIMPKRSE